MIIIKKTTLCYLTKAISLIQNRFLAKQVSSLTKEVEKLRMEVLALKSQLHEAESQKIDKDKIFHFLHQLLNTEPSNKILVDITFNKENPKKF